MLNSIPPLPMFALATISDPACFIGDITNEVVIGYCPQNQVGAIYHTDGRIWSVMGPMAFEEFASALHTRGLSLPDDAVTAAWVNAVSSRRGGFH